MRSCRRRRKKCGPWKGFGFKSQVHIVEAPVAKRARPVGWKGWEVVEEEAKDPSLCNRPGCFLPWMHATLCEPDIVVAGEKRARRPVPVLPPPEEADAFERAKWRKSTPAKAPRPKPTSGKRVPAASAKFAPGRACEGCGKACGNMGSLSRHRAVCAALNPSNVEVEVEVDEGASAQPRPYPWPRALGEESAEVELEELDDCMIRASAAPIR